MFPPLGPHEEIILDLMLMEGQRVKIEALGRRRLERRCIWIYVCVIVQAEDQQKDR